MVTMRCARLKFESISVHLGERGLPTRLACRLTVIPCSVSVIDCSSLSSSSVSVNCLDIDDPGRDMIALVVR